MQHTKSHLALVNKAMLGMGSMMLANAASAAVVSGSGIEVSTGQPAATIAPGVELQVNFYTARMNAGDVFDTYFTEAKLNSFAGVSFTDSLAAGTLIGPSTVFGNTSKVLYETHNGKYIGTSGATSGLYGFQMTNGTDVNYGWADISISDSTVVNFNPPDYGSTFITARVNQFAYSTAGETLVAGVTPVPEPESLALLAAGLGLVGIAAKRRRKTAAHMSDYAQLAA